MIFYEVSFIVSPERKILKKFESRKKAETYLMEIMKHVNMTNVKIEKTDKPGTMDLRKP